LYSLLCAALHYWRRACRARAWGRRRALSWLRTHYLWAARARAWWAFTLGLLALAAVKYNWLGLLYRALEHILA